MLKRYYGLNEAAEFLSSEHKQQIQPSDVLEMAARGEIRLCLWCDGLLAVFEYQEPVQSPKFLKTAGSFRGYIHMPSSAIAPRGGKHRFEQVFIFDEMPPSQEPERPSVSYPQFLGFVGHQDDLFNMGEAGIRDALASGSLLIPFTPTIDEIVVPAADLLALSPAKTTPHSKSGVACLHDAAYSTPYIAIMNAAIAEFFAPRRNVDAAKPEVAAWVMKQMEISGITPSNNIAEAIFTIIKPFDHDPRKRRG